MRKSKTENLKDFKDITIRMIKKNILLKHILESHYNKDNSPDFD